MPVVNDGNHSRSVVLKDVSNVSHWVHSVGRERLCKFVCLLEKIFCLPPAQMGLFFLLEFHALGFAAFEADLRGCETPNETSVGLPSSDCSSIIICRNLSGKYSAVLPYTVSISVYNALNF